MNRRGIVSRCKDAERIRGDRRLEEPARALVSAHEAVDLVPQAIIARAGLGEEVAPLVGRARDGRLEQFVDALPAMGIHLVKVRSGSTADGVVEPGAREAPVALDRGRRELQDLRNLVGGQAAEEFELDDPALARIDGAELIERLVEDDDVHVRRLPGFIGVAEWNFPHVPAPLAGGAVAGMVHENPPHHDRREADELRPVLPVHLPLIDQPKVRLVDERCGLEGVVAPLAEQIRGGQPAQLIVHERQHLVARPLVALAPVEQQSCDGVRRGRFFSHIAGCPTALAGANWRVRDFSTGPGVT